jgi:glutamate 5-kinase
MSLWDQLFGHVKQPIAQILLTRNDIADRTQYQNAQNTFFELMNMGVIPIVNENDTLAVTEIKFGDNDTLSAITAGMVQADYLFLMTDVDCLYDKNPRTNPDAKPITVIEDISDLEADVSSAGSALGTGGMSTKIVAARLATSAGVTTVITRSSKPGNISAIIKDAEAHRLGRISSRNSVYSESNFATSPRMRPIDSHAASPNLQAVDEHHQSEPGSLSNSTTLQTPATGSPEEAEPVPLHTRFLPIPHPIRDRWFWILHGLTPHGTIYIDQGAFQALSDKAGLLPAGIIDVEGNFHQQEAVRLVAVKRLGPHSFYHNQHKSTPPAVTTPPAMTSTGHSHAQSHTHTHAPTPDRTSLYERAHQGLIHSHSNTHLPLHHAVKESLEKQPLYETVNPAPYECGRAVVNYSAGEVRRIMGLHSTQIQAELGYADSEYVAVRENIALFDVERSRPSTPSLGRAVSESGRSVCGD